MAIDVQKILERVKAIQVGDPMTANTIDSLIDQTLEEINREYRPGTYIWMKRNRPQKWERSMHLEGRICGAAQRSDLEAVKEALAEYKSLMLAAIKEFSLTNEVPSPGCLTDKLGTVGP